MSATDCIKAVNEAAGRELSTDELEALITEVRAKRAYLLAKGLASDLQSAALKAADQFANNIRMAAVIEKRNAALNLVKRTERLEWARQTFGTKITEAIESILVGTNRAKQGARDGVAQIQNSLRRYYQSGLVGDLVKQDLHGIWASGTLDRDVARALWAIGREDEAKVHAGIQKEAVDVAKIIDKWQEYTRVEANKEGAWIGKRTGYIVRQTHDPYRITRAGKDAWVEAAKKYFDLAAMLGESGSRNIDEMLGALYVDMASGHHMKVDDEALNAAFTGGANLAKKISQSREIIFKDSDAWFDYNQQFGQRNLRDAVVSGLNHSADATGMMRMLGTNPKQTIAWLGERLRDDAQKAGDIEQLNRATSKRGSLDNYMAVVDGSMNSPGSHILARVGSRVRGIESMAKLGSMIFSQIQDLVQYSSSMKIQGRGFFSSMGEAIGGLGKSLKSKERFELLSSLDVAMESLTGELGRTGSFNEPGSFAKAQALFMKLNLGQWWTERLKGAALEGMSHNMALQKGKAFADLHPDYQRTLNVYGIGAAEWEKIRSVASKEVDGREYITPELVRGLEGGEQLERNLRNYFTDRLGYVVLEPDAKVKAVMLRGTRPGTWEGEFARFLMQFKSFTGSYMLKSLGQELYGRGYMGDSLIGALRAGNGEMLGLARLITMSTLAGYASLTLKDAVKNRSPRDLSDPHVAWKTFLASFLQGGGAGIYGDFLFGESSRYGNSMLETLAGPTFTTVSSMANLVHQAERGDEKAETIGSQALRLAIQNTPFVNLFYTKMALDYFILNDVYDSLSPGYMRRMERRLEKDNGQHFLVRPQ